MKLKHKQLFKLSFKLFIILGLSLSYRKITSPRFLFRKRRMVQNAKKISKYTQNKFLELERNLPVGEQLLNGVSYIYGSRVHGDIAEFGTQTASSAAVLATSLNLYNLKPGMTQKRIHFFDSFEGLPSSESIHDNDSPHVQSGLWSKNKCIGLTQIEFYKTILNFVPTEFFTIYGGWFKDSVKTINPEQKFALIHIDSDLYQSAIDALDFLFKKELITFGAHIYFDDYFCNNSNPFYGEQKAWAEISSAYKINYTNLGNYSVFGNRFLINSYSVN